MHLVTLPFKAGAWDEIIVDESKAWSGECFDKVFCGFRLACLSLEGSHLPVWNMVLDSFF